MNRLWQWQDGGPITVQVGRPLLTRLWAWARRGGDSALGACLIGTVHSNEAGIFRVVVTDFLPVENTHSIRGDFTFKGETFAQIQRDYPVPASDLPVGHTCVGWVHTHPGGGVQFSEADLETHHTHFSWPFQVAMIVDPRNHLANIVYWESPGQMGPSDPDARDAWFDPATGLFAWSRLPQRFKHPEPLRWVFVLCASLVFLGILAFGWGIAQLPQPPKSDVARLLPANDDPSFRWVLPDERTSWLYALTPAGAQPSNLNRMLSAQRTGPGAVMIALQYEAILASQLTGPLWLWLQGERESAPISLPVPELVEATPQTGAVIPLGGGRFALREPDNPRTADRVMQVIQGAK